MTLIQIIFRKYVKRYSFLAACAASFHGDDDPARHRRHPEGLALARSHADTKTTEAYLRASPAEKLGVLEGMEGTVAQSIVDPENPKTALSVRAMLTAHLGALEFLPDSGKPFSIRDWIGKKEGQEDGQKEGQEDGQKEVAKDSGGFLFLTSRGDQHASLRGLISTWLEIAVNALLSLDQDGGRRVWVILDELPTLHQVPSLQPGLAESRQFGGCFVLGIQVSSALRDLYGKNGAETISGLCGTRVVLAAPDRDTAQWSADSLGGAEVEEISEAFSYGANTIRDGVSLTPKRELRSLALPRCNDNPWVIAGKKPGSHLTDLQYPWRRIRARAELDDVRIHDLRHSFASRALALGESLPMIGKLLGHTQVQTTARYAHLASDTVKASGSRIADSIGADILGKDTKPDAA